MKNQNGDKSSTMLITWLCPYLWPLSITNLDVVDGSELIILSAIILLLVGGGCKKLLEIRFDVYNIILVKNKNTM